MMAPYENPAQRLNVILGLICSHSQQRPVRGAWADVLGIDEHDTPSLILGVAATIELFNRVKSRVSMTSPSEVRTAWIEPVRATLVALSNLDAPLSLATHNIDQATRLSLSACEELFPPATSDPRIVTEDRLAQAARLTDQLLDELAGAGLEQSAHELLVRQVLALQNAIKLYKVVGQSGLYDAILSANAALHVTVNGDLRKPWYSHVRESLGTIADVLTIATAGGQAVATITSTINPS